MKLNKNNIFGKYYNWIYEEYPKDVCSFFWGTLLIVLLFPLVIPGRLFKKIDNSGPLTNGGILGLIFIGTILWLFYILFFHIGLACYQGITKDMNISIWMFLVLPIVTFLGISIISILALLIIASPFYIHDQIKQKRRYSMPEKEETHKIRDFIAAIRGKYCTKITWE